MVDLRQLADLIRARNNVDNHIAALIDRPALIGHIGEVIAAEVFDIRLHDSATTKGTDGHFTVGSLAGRSVNVKWYPKLEGILDIHPNAIPDEYLVLAGPRSAAASSRGTTRPLTISSVFLFQGRPLVESLHGRGLRIGVATSIRREFWDAAMIYPEARNPRLQVTDEQQVALALFNYGPTF